tara:strand:- start:50 stop:568 length:519 start_codon:yes stop_codon:yes gene_type:complete
MRNTIEKVREYAFNKHREVNQKYDDKCYTYHLECVYGTAQQFLMLIPDQDREDVLSACYLHDIIEDARETYNDVLKQTNKRVAELVYALTNEKGKNRKERASDKYYKGIRETEYAGFIKLCDRIANVEYSQQTGSSMFKKYRSENKEFCKKIYNEKYIMLFNYLEYIFRQQP